MIIEKLKGAYYGYDFKIEILNQKITVGELRSSFDYDTAYLTICFPENNSEAIKINAKYDTLDETIEKVKKIISKKMYVLADQILCSLKETKNE